MILTILNTTKLTQMSLFFLNSTFIMCTSLLRSSSSQLTVCSLYYNMFILSLKVHVANTSAVFIRGATCILYIQRNVTWWREDAIHVPHATAGTCDTSHYHGGELMITLHESLRMPQYNCEHKNLMW